LIAGFVAAGMYYGITLPSAAVASRPVMLGV